MKKLTYLKETMIQLSIVAGVLLYASCDINQKAEDAKGVAEEKNEAKFDNNQQKKDAHFLVNVAEMNLEEIQLGRLAQQKGSTKEVKALGKMMEDAHTKLQSDVTALAKNKGIDVPSTPTDNTQDAYYNLNKKSGNNFDEAYTDQLVNKHRDAIQSFEKASTDSYDGDIKLWAIDALPELHIHLDHSVHFQKKSASLYLEKN